MVCHTGWNQCYVRFPFCTCIVQMTHDFQCKWCAIRSVCGNSFIYLVHSQSPAYPREMVEYPPYNNLSMVSPFFRRASAPFCQRIGATSEGVPFNLSCLAINALWQSSSLSSISSQNLFISLPEEHATSTRFKVTTPLIESSVEFEFIIFVLIYGQERAASHTGITVALFEFFMIFSEI